MANKKDEDWLFHNYVRSIYLSIPEIDIINTLNKSILSFRKKAKDMEEYAKLEEIATELNQKFLGLNRKERVIRDIILGFHLEIERQFDILINLYFTIGGGTKKTRSELSTIVLPKLDFCDKLEIIRKSELLKPKSINDAGKINEIRNGFAHGHKKESRRFYYRSGCVFKKASIDRIMGDYNNILKNISQRIDELLENYSGSKKSKK